MKRLTSLTIIWIMILISISFVAYSKSYKIADQTGDWGYPTPFLRYPRGPGYIRMSFIFETLVWKEQDGFVPLLAESWEYNENENFYIFNLREDVYWHDGEKFTAEDVVFSFNYMNEHPEGHPWVDLASIDSVKKLNNYSVKVKLKEIYAPFLSDIAGTLVIIPKHIWKDVKEPKKFSSENAVIGTGPFRLADYNKIHGSYLYKANPNYYLGKSEVERLIFIKVNREMTPTALKQEKVNAASVPPEVVEEMKKREFTVIKGTHDWNAKLMINHRKEPLSSKKFRHALAYAINRKEIVQVALRGHGIKGNPGLISPDSFWYNPNVKQYEYNPQKAKEFLEELGYNLEEGYYWKDRKLLKLEMKMSGVASENFTRVSEVIKSQLESVGIKIELRSMESKTLDAMIVNGQYELVLSGHGGLGGEPKMLNRMIHGESHSSVQYYKNDKLNELLKKQIREMDIQKRKNMVDKIQEIYAEELPAITIYYPTWYWVHDGSIELYYTKGGIAIGIPIPLNKLAFLT